MVATAKNLEVKKQEILDILISKEKLGFKYGEVGKFLQDVADRTNTSLSQVQTIYYGSVKGNFENNPNTSSTSTSENSKLDPNDNITNIFTINEKEVRVVEDKDVGKKYFVAKDVHDSIDVDRTSPISKEGIKKEYKHYVPIKSAYGYVKTMVYQPEGLKNFLELVMSKHTSKITKEKTEIFYNYLIKFIDGTLDNDLTTLPMNETSPQEVNVAPAAEEIVKVPTEETTTIKKPSYKYNDLVEVQVAHIAKYGVLVETLDEFGIQGLIHLSDVRHGYVSDLELYFEVGDKLKVHVKKFDKVNNRLNLSTKEIKLPLKSKKIEEIKKEKEEIPKNDTLALELEKVKEKIVFDESEQIVKQEELPIEETDEVKTIVGTNTIINHTPVDSYIQENDMVNTNQVTNQSFEEIDAIIEGNKEIQRLITILNGKVGAISPLARQKLIKIINDQGIVDFTIAMMNVIPEFKADLGLMILAEIEGKIGEYL